MGLDKEIKCDILNINIKIHFIKIKSRLKKQHFEQGNKLKILKT